MIWKVKQGLKTLPRVGAANDRRSCARITKQKSKLPRTVSGSPALRLWDPCSGRCWGPWGFSWNPWVFGEVETPSAGPLPRSPDLPNVRPFFLFLPQLLFFSSSLFRGLLVELCSRFTAVDHLKCAFGLLWLSSYPALRQVLGS